MQTIIKDFPQPRKVTIQTIYWIISGLTILSFIIYSVFSQSAMPSFFNGYVISFLFIIFISKFLGCIFLLVDDIFRLFRWSYQFVATYNQPQQREGISRLKFLTYISAGFFATSFLSLFYGLVKGAHNYKVHNVKISFKNLPLAFNGLKIVQISDIHTGSYVNTDALSHAFDMVLELKPDIIFFTGDLVNDRVTETEDFLPVYQKLKAPMGVYSILGNHDYGDYSEWESAQAKADNLETLKKVHEQAGWRLLMNEHIALEKNGQQIALLGIENWGGNLHFKKYGRMDLANAGTEKYDFKMLLSHDPSHWDKQVKEQYKDVDLTFSGHTHGAQFGVEIPGIKWSPSQWFYTQWAGLYNKGNQYLYVNRGLGCVGKERVSAYNGRLGIWPEITFMELNKG